MTFNKIISDSIITQKPIKDKFKLIMPQKAINISIRSSFN